MAEASRARALAAISAYYGRGAHERLVERNPCAVVERPQPATAKQNQARALSQQQVAQLLEAARERSPLHHALCCLLFYNALRVSEACGADVEDLSDDQGYRVLRIQGKGTREKNVRVPLNHPTVRAIDTHLAGRTTGPMFASRRQDGSTVRLSRQAAYGMVSRLADSAGVGPLSPHGLRATLVTLALAQGIALRDVQDSARHADPRTTRRYDRDRHLLGQHAALRLDLS